MRRQLLWYFVLTLLQLVSVFIFAIGYFPAKTLLKGESESYSLGNNGILAEGDNGASFKKLVFVVIDALRSDFLYYNESSHFHNLHALLNQGKAIGFTAYSNPPTVTLPRLKGITTGSTPIFLDAILNVAEDDSSSNLIDQDSIIKQFYNSEHMNKIKFYGDDTWLKLFGTSSDSEENGTTNQPYFVDYEGTNSFFVSDFVEVDNNVTRHIQHNMEHQDEWDVLILHYLGLDHIGHKGGAHSQFMKPKQLEMDAIIQRIYDDLDEDSLMVVLGDHGMNDLGNHGGSSAGETSSGLCFISKKFDFADQLSEQVPVEKYNEDYKYLNQATQIDLVPTLMALFNLPIPLNNVGVIIPELLPLIENENLQKFHLDQNYKQLRNLINYNDNKDINDEFSNEELYERMLDIQDTLLKKATEYNRNKLYLGIALLVVVNILTFCYTFELTFRYVLIVGISILLGSSTFGSSFVEEEHQIWWWVAILFYCGSVVLRMSDFTRKKLNLDRGQIIKIITGLVCLRLIRAWNNSGQKFQYDYVLASIIPSQTLWYLNFIAIALPCFEFFFNQKWLVFLILSFGAVSCFTYKLHWSIINENIELSSIISYLKQYLPLLSNNDDLVEYARFFFKYVGVSLLFNELFTKNEKNTTGKNDGKLKLGLKVQVFLILTSFILILQSAPTNIPLFGLFYILNYCVQDIIPDSYMSIWILILEHLCFFQFGATNSINTINLTNAYNGVSNNYNIYIVGLLMNISNFSPAIYWALLGANTQEYQRNTLIFYNIFGVCLLLSCFINRYHLFVWSVFSPKLCYHIGWSLFMNVIVKYIFTLIM